MQGWKSSSGAHRGSGAISSPAMKLAWVLGLMSVLTGGSRHHNSLGGDNTLMVTPSCLSGAQGGNRKGTGQLSVAVTVGGPQPPRAHGLPGL